MEYLTLNTVLTHIHLYIYITSTYTFKSLTSPRVQLMLLQFVHGHGRRSVIHLQYFNEVSYGKHSYKFLFEAVPKRRSSNSCNGQKKRRYLYFLPGRSCRTKKIQLTIINKGKKGFFD